MEQNKLTKQAKCLKKHLRAGLSVALIIVTFYFFVAPLVIASVFMLNHKFFESFEAALTSRTGNPLSYLATFAPLLAISVISFILLFFGIRGLVLHFSIKKKFNKGKEAAIAFNGNSDDIDAALAKKDFQGLSDLLDRYCGLYDDWVKQKAIPAKAEFDAHNPGYFDFKSKEASTYDGYLIQRLFWKWCGLVLACLTLGICMPLKSIFLQRHLCAHKTIGGKRLRFDGKFSSLLGHYILWWFLSMITFGIYFLWVPGKVKIWIDSNTHIEGEEGESTNTMKPIGYMGHLILGGIVSVLTLGLGLCWAKAYVERYYVSHSAISGRKLLFLGTGTSLFGHYILWWLLCIPTFGIFALFIPTRLIKWGVGKTYFDPSVLKEGDDPTASPFYGLTTIATLPVPEANAIKKLILAQEIEEESKKAEKLKGQFPTKAASVLAIIIPLVLVGPFDGFFAGMSIYNGARILLSLFNDYGADTLSKELELGMSEQEVESMFGPNVSSSIGEEWTTNVYVDFSIGPASFKKGIAYFDSAGLLGLYAFPSEDQYEDFLSSDDPIEFDPFDFGYVDGVYTYYDSLTESLVNSPDGVLRPLQVDDFFISALFGDEFDCFLFLSGDFACRNLYEEDVLQSGAVSRFSSDATYEAISFDGRVSEYVYFSELSRSSFEIEYDYSSISGDYVLDYQRGSASTLTLNCAHPKPWRLFLPFADEGYVVRFSEETCDFSWAKEERLFSLFPQLLRNQIVDFEFEGTIDDFPIEDLDIGYRFTAWPDDKPFVGDYVLTPLEWASFYGYSNTEFVIDTPRLYADSNSWTSSSSCAPSTIVIDTSLDEVLIKSGAMDCTYEIYLLDVNAQIEDGAFSSNADIHFGGSEEEARECLPTYFDNIVEFNALAPDIGA